MTDLQPSGEKEPEPHEIASRESVAMESTEPRTFDLPIVFSRDEHRDMRAGVDRMARNAGICLANEHASTSDGDLEKEEG